MKKINDVLRAFSALETEGFHRKGKRWTRRSSETIVVVDLQKSSWGNNYFLNFAVWLLPAGEPPESLREELCHLRTRLGSEVEYAMDLEYEMDPDERRDTLRTLLEDTVLPLADRCKTLSGCASVVGSGGLFPSLPEATTRLLGLTNPRT